MVEWPVAQPQHHHHAGTALSLNPPFSTNLGYTELTFLQRERQRLGLANASEAFDTVVVPCVGLPPSSVITPADHDAKACRCLHGRKLHLCGQGIYSKHLAARMINLSVFSGLNLYHIYIYVYIYIPEPKPLYRPYTPCYSALRSCVPQ